MNSMSGTLSLNQNSNAPYKPKIIKEKGAEPTDHTRLVKHEPQGSKVSLLGIVIIVRDICFILGYLDPQGNVSIPPTSTVDSTVRTPKFKMNMASGTTTDSFLSYMSQEERYGQPSYVHSRHSPKK